MKDSSQPLLLDGASVREWTKLIPGRNLFHVFQDYLCLFLLHGTAILIFEESGNWGWPRWSLLLVGGVTILLTGCLFHRIALLGHEASHHLLQKNRKRNDILADLLCFFPLWASLANYRKKHSGHHLHPNEPGVDPNLASAKSEALFQSFPLERPASFLRYYALFFWPPFVLRYLFDIVRAVVTGNSGNKGSRGRDDHKREGPFWRRWSPGVVGIFYLLAFFGVLWVAKKSGSEAVLIGLPLGFHLLVGLLGCLLLPESFFGRRDKLLSYSPRMAAALRLSFGAVLMMTVTWFRHFTGIHLGLYYVVFWLAPLLYVFPYLMLLRELYQHANLGTGTIDNSRIIHVGPVSRWALLPYGNDFHLIHHIYPNIPHYHLRAAHRALLERSENYRSGLIEVEGTFRGKENPSVAESLAR